VLVAAGGDIRIRADGDLANPTPAAMRVLVVVIIVGILVGRFTFIAPARRRRSPRLGTQPVVNAVTNPSTTALPVCMAVATA